MNTRNEITITPKIMYLQNTNMYMYTEAMLKLLIDLGRPFILMTGQG